MAALTRSLPALARAGDAVLTTHAQLIFSRNRWVGCLLLAAAASVPRYLLLGLVALAGTTLAVRALHLSGPGTYTYVPYGYNALLVGYAIAQGYALDAASLSLTFAMGAVCAFVTAALSSLAGYFGWLPVLAAPFTVSAGFVAGVAPHIALSGALPPASEPVLPPLLDQLLHGLGSAVFMPSLAAGACVLTALLVHSRIASVLAISAALLMLGLFEVAHAPVSDSLAQLTVGNAVLAAIALGGVWLIPSRGSFGLALLGALLTGFFALGLARPLLRLGLSLGFVPWNLAVISILAALRQRVSERAGLRLAAIAAASPEQLLLADVPERALAGEPTAMRLHLPFIGRWSCTQGIDGAYTHRGTWRHAFDFEVYGELDGGLCSGDGTRAADYRCFGLPVLAAADGTVMAIENDVPNNEIGEVSLDKPWGNQVTLQHAVGLYSVVAHLAPGTIAVYPGQFVRRGSLLGYLGNSGRAPRPHLHFQLQSAVALGSATVPCRFVDVIVRRGDRAPHYELAHVPREGEALRAVEPDHTLSAYFELPAGARFTYRLGKQLDQLEQLEAEVDAWGQVVLRSIERGSELVLSRGEGYFACGELRGSERSVLAWLRLCLMRVPFDREPGLAFQRVIPQRWFGGTLRRWAWDFTAAWRRVPGVILHATLERSGDQLTVHGSSQRRDARGVPQLETRVVLTRGVGPTLVEVNVAGRVQRAELVISRSRAFANDAVAHTALPGALGLGDLS